MYQPYPQGGEMPPESGRPTPPRPVRTAVLLMYVGAALTAISLIVTVATLHTIETAIQNNSTYTAQQAHQLAVAAVVEYVVTLGLWLLMAWANRAGQNWARIVATVLFGLNTLGLLLNVFRGSASISVLFAVLVWLVGLGAVVLLWRRESSQYFAARRIRS
ncbi:MAG TPA: hypothetical protein VKD66_12030 [Streptosporangiaceae bacterium]|nr:hypothetical protein [Streptosporangiaceae bacterium]